MVMSLSDLPDIGCHPWIRCASCAILPCGILIHVPDDLILAPECVQGSRKKPGSYLALDVHFGSVHLHR